VLCVRRDIKIEQQATAPQHKKERATITAHVDLQFTFK
jgi:hypothetical protein